jgi:iron complex outermembrane receptor protein
MSLSLALNRRLLPVGCLLAATALLPLPRGAQAQEPTIPPSQDQTQNPPSASAPGSLPAVAEKIEVTATRVPEDVEPVPASITVIGGEELQARGATDLSSALATVAGVAIAPGGDNGPGSSVPELWGLREFDAFLLVVDGVPWGGAFNPALPDLDLTDVDRIEVLRGSAPVMFGATSFVGVIHVIHRQAGTPGGTVRGSIGSYGSGDLAAAAALPQVGEYRQSLSVHGERQGFRDDRADYGRGNLLYRGLLPTATGSFHVDFNTTIVRQSPASPVPRDGTRLTPLVPLDSNQNPRGAHIDDDRFHLTTGYDTRLGSGSWSTTLAVTHLTRGVGRGFLENFDGTDPDDHGIRQHLTTNDVYFDSHVAFDLSRELRLVAGVDHLFGQAHNASSDWDYFQNVNGSNPPNIASFAAFGATDLRDTRNFSGLYAQTEWTPQPRFRLQLGARLNHTYESLDATSVDLTAAAAAAAGVAPKDVSVGPGSDKRTVTRASGAAGASYLVWQQSGAEGIWLYGDYRNTFKPAALDFGPDVNGIVLKPETSQSYEAGLKGRGFGGLDWEVSVFEMSFSNLVVGQVDPDGLGHLVNAGRERFKGVEIETEYRFSRDAVLRAVYSYHDARFRDFIDVTDDGTNVQVAGDRLPMSARHLGGAGFIYRPASGPIGWVSVNYVGDRFLDPQNVALVPSYTTWGAGIGYRFARWELRLDGWNLNDTRPPVAASELGPDQFYLLPARSFRLAGELRF